jgi:hypothetical protein
MRVLLVCAAVALFAATSSAVVVADYQNQFASPTPGTGWSYLWNPTNVPLYSNPSTFTGNSANYIPLSYNSTGSAYETQSTGSLPLANPGAFLSAASTHVTLGQSQTQASDGNSHYVILAYTFSAAQVAADGPNLSFHTYDFNIPTDASMGNVDVAVFKNDALEFTYPGGFPEGTTFSDATYIPDYPFPDPVHGGDTLYIALGDLGNYSGQQIGVAFTLALTPEPTAICLLAFAPLALRRRRA